MKRLLFAILLLVGATTFQAAEAYSPLTRVIFNAAYGDFISMFQANVTRQQLATRLAFHGCVGGCNGCINLNQADNGGLSDIVSVVDTLYRGPRGYNNAMSNGDFWAIMSMAAVGQGIIVANAGCPLLVPNCVSPALSTVFRYGRIDCDNAPETNVVYPFPSGAMNGSAMFAYFATNFGLSAPSVVALMGVHTIGKAVPQNSGYTGTWKPSNPAAFTNAFYTQMLALPWVNEVLSGVPNKYQWFGADLSGNQIQVLNTDMEVAFDVTLNPATSQATCTINGGVNPCGLAATYSQALRYAGDNVAWVKDFGPAFGQMLENTNAPLYNLV